MDGCFISGSFDIRLHLFLGERGAATSTEGDLSRDIFPAILAESRLMNKLHTLLKKREVVSLYTIFRKFVEWRAFEKVKRGIDGGIVGDRVNVLVTQEGYMSFRLMYEEVFLGDGFSRRGVSHWCVFLVFFTIENDARFGVDEGSGAPF